MGSIFNAKSLDAHLTMIYEDIVVLGIAKPGRTSSMIRTSSAVGRIARTTSHAGCLDEPPACLDGSTQTSEWIQMRIQIRDGMKRGLAIGILMVLIERQTCSIGSGSHK